MHIVAAPAKSSLVGRPTCRHAQMLMHALHTVRADRLCTCCDAGALGDERHLVFE